MTAIQWGAIATLTAVLLAAVFHAGQLSARLEAIEKWRLELRADLLQLMRAVQRIQTRLGIEED